MKTNENKVRAYSLQIEQHIFYKINQSRTVQNTSDLLLKSEISLNMI